jgi:hypothetical protein
MFRFENPVINETFRFIKLMGRTVLSIHSTHRLLSSQSFVATSLSTPGSYLAENSIFNINLSLIILTGQMLDSGEYYQKKDMHFLPSNKYF